MKLARSLFLAFLMFCTTVATVKAQTSAPEAGMATAGATATAAATTVNSVDQSLATVVVGDIGGLLDQFGQLASQSNPSMSGASLRSMLGAQIGDPDLKGLPAGSGAIVLFFPTGEKMAMIEVDPASVDQYKSLAVSRGAMADTADGLLILATDQRSLDAGKAIAATAKTRFLASPAKDVNITIQMKRIMDLYGTQAEGLIMMMSGQISTMAAQSGAASQPNTQGLQNILEGELRGFLEVARQVDTANIVLSFNEQGMLLQKTVKPVQGTALATLTAAPTSSVDALAKMVGGDGAVHGYGAFNGQAMADFVNAVAKNVIARMPNMPADMQQTVSTMTAQVAKYQGFAANYIVPGQKFPSGEFVYQTASAADAQQVLANSLQLMQSPAIANMYKGLGADVTFTVKDKAREHKGASVTQVNIDAKGMPTTPGMQFPMTIELAAVDKYMAISLNEGSLDATIDAIQAGANPKAQPVKATTALPTGADMYMDISVGNMLTAMQPLMQGTNDAQLQQVQQALSGAAPISMSVDMAAGAIKGLMLIPADLINRIAKMAQQQSSGAAAMPSGSMSDSMSGSPSGSMVAPSTQPVQ